MADYGTVSFHNARESGVVIAQLSSGTYDHLGFYGSTGTSSAVEISLWNDSTIIIDDSGNEAPHYGGFGGSGFCTNNKYMSSSGVQIGMGASGFGTKNINEVNVFNAANLGTYPDFANRPSGTLMIRYVASGTSDVYTYNCKLYAYKADGSLTDAPEDVTIAAYEINASGTANASQSGAWVLVQGSNNPLNFVDHSSANSWVAQNEHIWVAGISAKPNAVGTLDNWNIAWTMQYA